MDEYRFIREWVKAKHTRGVVFDFDGTLAQLVVNWNELRSVLQSTFSVPLHGINEIFEYIKNNYAPEVLSQAYRLVETYELARIEEAQINTPLIRLAQELHHQQHQLAIFSNNMQKTVNCLLEKVKIATWFDPIITKERVAFYKPHPEGLQMILHHWHYQEDEILFIGNDENDTQSGSRAGIATILI